ncbi:ClbS/DfsB family four-helix bundle protein [Rhizobiaceae bacterium BDR2-2]|uniref:ClbS/DfsB family four-helix bundle protein n=1 Tax=Ectorhizobium quercum TaxID=2965071 RepID=A0AAE3SVC6_9HYPH|nr:ClbS/DfsB family four-helix bundle protein [Ectorhizobium quercum]MCX8996819.1 ClbS/DfsB family four-helix bundle protein [Ectorhizobium quercum]
MAVAFSKAQLLAVIEKNYDRLLRELKAIPAERVFERSLEGRSKGTTMSVADIVAYLIGWNALLLKWQERRAAGLPVDFPETGYKWNELGRLAEKFHADYAALGWEERLERLDLEKGRTVALIGRLDDDALYGLPFYGQYPLGRMIQFNTAAPYENARKRVRAWKKANGLN